MGETSSAGPGGGETPGIPPLSLSHLFLRFLKFGALAWGGPVAQIAMIRQELVEEERWISRAHFNRALAVYQVLPGPEAHELCVYFGMLARGRVGGTLAGLGFMLPGFLLMLVLSALYATGLLGRRFEAFFLGIEPAVVALVFRAVHRIGAHALTHPWLWAGAGVAAVAHLTAVPFWITLPLAGLSFGLGRARALTAALPLLLLVVIAWLWRAAPVAAPDIATAAEPSLLQLFASGLRAGLLTFGGAYTVLPFLQRDAVGSGGWMTAAEFLDGVALSGILPAPFIIFATFVGYVGGGLGGALALTVGVFLPAFAFTLVAHHPLERIVSDPRVRTFLDGVTAGVVGFIAATALGMLAATVRSPLAAGIFLAALAALYAFKAPVTVAVVMLAAGALGLILRP